MRRTKAARPTAPADVSTSISALGGWNWNGNRSVYHQRSPTPNHGSEDQTVMESWNHVRRWKTELNWFPDCTWSCTRFVTKRTSGATSSSTSLDRRRSVRERRTRTKTAATRPMTACLDWVSRTAVSIMPMRTKDHLRLIPAHAGRADHDRPHRADRAREVLVHAIREARVDRAQVAVRDVYQTFYDGDGRQDGDGADEQAETGAGVTVGADGPSDEKRSGHEHPGVRPLDGVRRVRVVDDRDQRGELVHRRGPEDRTQAGGEGPPGEKKSWDGGRCEGEVREREVDPSAADAEDDEEQG